jgi:predicted methyltransferase
LSFAAGAPATAPFSRELKPAAADATAPAANRRVYFVRSLPIICLATVLTLSGAMASAAPSASIASAISDPSRPPEDRARDANRKPAETLAFAAIPAGAAVGDYLANAGYFTRLFADLVGPEGHVYAVELNEVVSFPNVARGYAQLTQWGRTQANVSIATVPASADLKFPRPLDVFWISQNYHDLHDKFLGPKDVAAFNRQVFAVLKPGGLYLVLDHAAAPGAAADVTETLHRIEAATVKREVLAAGFELVSESAVLANPQDPHTRGVFDPSIAGHTDQFFLKFRRPRAPATPAKPTES